MRSGSRSSTSNAARHAAATAGGCEVENRNGPRAMIQEFDQVAAAADIAAEHADSFRERSYLNIHPPMEPK